jgi:signal transduction histidine kinase/ligand-binding sensor domain-containing protein
VLIVIILVLVSPSFSQGLDFHTYTTAEGLLSNNIKFLHQDRNGFLWIGSSEGICVYDGVRFSSFSGEDGLPYSEVYDIAEDSSGTIWLATLHGIRRYVDGRFELIWPDTSVNGHDFVHSLMVDPSGALWFAGARGLFRMMGRDVRQIGAIGTPAQNPHFACDGGDIVWIVADHRMWQYSISGNLLTSMGPVPPGNGYVRSILASGDSVLWLLTNSGTLCRVAGSAVMAERRGLMNDAMFLLDGGEGNFWIGGGEGLLQLSQSGFVSAPAMHYDITSGLPQNLILCGMADREGSLWFGTQKEGLAKLASRHLRTIALPFQYRIHDNMGACSDEAGHLWTSAKDGVLELFQDNNRMWHSEKHRMGGRKHPVRSIQLDRMGRLWVDFVGGDLHCYARTAFSGRAATLSLLFSLRGVFPEGERFAIAFDHENNIWFSIMRLGVGKIDVAKRRLVHLYTEKDGSQLTSVRTILVDRKDNIWMGDFYRGLSVASGGPRIIRHFTRNDGLPDECIRALCEAKDGSIWIGTRYGGVAVYRDRTFHTVSMRDGLRSNAIWSFTEDHRGNMWCGTFAGLQPVNSHSLKPALFAHGLNEPGIANCGSFPGGTLWGVSADRLLLYENGADTLVSVPPLVHLRHIYVNEKMIAMSTPLELSHTRNNVRFEFIGLSFREERGVKYMFRLEGLEQEWRQPSPQREVTYANLDPGSYLFEAKAVNTDGVASEQAARFAFVIEPPFWQLWWFQAVAVFAFAVFAGGTVRWRIARRQRREAKQQEFQLKLLSLQESERKRIASGLHDSLGQNLLILKNVLEQSMMNNKEGGGELRELSELTQQALDEVREIAFDLHPHVLDRLGLRKAIETAVEKANRASSTRTSTEFVSFPERLPDQVAIGLYRIAQEALSNIVKHSGATSASITISAHPGMLHLLIADNGVGFDADEYLTRPPERWSLGLLNIAERVRLFGGTYAFDSVPGRGTTLTVDIPMEQHNV